MNDNFSSICSKSLNHSSYSSFHSYSIIFLLHIDWQGNKDDRFCLIVKLSYHCILSIVYRLGMINIPLSNDDRLHLFRMLFQGIFLGIHFRTGKNHQDRFCIDFLNKFHNFLNNKLCIVLFDQKIREGNLEHIFVHEDDNRLYIVNKILYHSVCNYLDMISIFDRDCKYLRGRWASIYFNRKQNRHSKLCLIFRLHKFWFLLSKVNNFH